MNIHTSKIALAKIVLDIENPVIIEDIFHLIQTKSQLTENQKAAIDEALDALENNEGIPHDQVMEETKKRYSKYYK